MSEKPDQRSLQTDSGEILGDFKKLEFTLDKLSKVLHASSKLERFLYAFRHWRRLSGVARSGYQNLNLPH